MRAIALVFVLAASTIAAAQPAPTPSPQPKRTSTSAPSSNNTKPKPIYYGDCLGTTVYVTNREYRECCLLCSVGDDSMSKAEIAEAEAAQKAHPEPGRDNTTINIDARPTTSYFTAFLDRRGAGTDSNAATPANNAAGPATSRQGDPPGKPPRDRPRNRYGGFTGLKM